LYIAFEPYLRRILEDVERSGGILEGCREDF